jgi:hypothetical protein
MEKYRKFRDEEFRLADNHAEENVNGRSLSPMPRKSKPKLPSNPKSVVDAKDENSFSINEAVVQDKYDALLRSMIQSGEEPSSRKGLTDKKLRKPPLANIYSRKSAAISFQLPPQQLDPGDSLELSPDNSILIESSEDVESNIRKSDEENLSMTIFDPLSPEVSKFIQTAQSPFVEMDFSWMEDIETKLLEFLIAGLRVSENSILNEDQRINVLGSSTALPPYLFPTPGKTMPTLKAQLDEAMKELVIRQREGAKCWDCNEVLRKDIGAARSLIKRTLDLALENINRFKQQNLLIKQDIAVGKEWVNLAGDILRSIEASLVYLLQAVIFDFKYSRIDVNLSVIILKLFP